MADSILPLTTPLLIEAITLPEALNPHYPTERTPPAPAFIFPPRDPLDLLLIVGITKNKTAAGTFSFPTKLGPRTRHQGLAHRINSVRSLKRPGQKKRAVHRITVALPTSASPLFPLQGRIVHHPQRSPKVWTPTKIGRATPMAHHNTMAGIMLSTRRGTPLPSIRHIHSIV